MQWFAIALSIGFYVGFGLIYNAVNNPQPGLTNPYWVMETALSDPVQYLILLLTAVLIMLPRYRVFCSVRDKVSFNSL